MNVAGSADGRWRTLEPDAMFKWTKTIGAAYRAELSRMLAEKGFALRPAGRDQIEIVGVGEDLIETFSKRSREIEAIVGDRAIPSSVTIRQTLFDISIKQVTGESTSYSTRVIAEADPKADRYRFWYSYDNRPKAEFHSRSTQHEGVAWLEISLADAPDRLNGQYFTSRRSTGDMYLVRDQPN